MPGIDGMTQGTGTGSAAVNSLPTDIRLDYDPSAQKRGGTIRRKKHNVSFTISLS
jgi:hypothetical protein